MHTASVSLLTALHALTHRWSLTPADLSAIEAAGAPLTPELWHQTVGLLLEARGRPGPADLDLGFTTLIYSWLGVEDETGFRERFGTGLPEALSADAAKLYRVARAIDSPQCPAREAVRCQITVAWCDRADLLLAKLPENAAAAVEALESALAHCPPDETWHARLYEALAAAAAVTGDRNREINAKARLAALQGRNEPEDHPRLHRGPPGCFRFSGAVPTMRTSSLPSAGSTPMSRPIRRSGSTCALRSMVAAWTGSRSRRRASSRGVRGRLLPPGSARRLKR